MKSNPSGLNPRGYSLVVSPKQIDQVTESGIQIMSDMEFEREMLKQTDAVVLAIGPMAFKDESEDRCKVGDRVVMRAYAGLLRKGVDGKQYRIIADTEVIAVIEED